MTSNKNQDRWGRGSYPEQQKTGLDEFATRIRDMRIDLGISQGDLARQIGSSQTYISFVENGEISELKIFFLLYLAIALNPEETDPQRIVDLTMELVKVVILPVACAALRADIQQRTNR